MRRSGIIGNHTHAAGLRRRSLGAGVALVASVAMVLAGSPSAVSHADAAPAVQPNAAEQPEQPVSEVVPDTALAAAAGPGVRVPAGILTTGNGTVLWQRRGAKSRPMASTTKIMTAAIVLDRVRPREVVTISARAARTPWSSITLPAGSRYRAIDLVEAMLVYSANNAATALAEHVSGSTKRFARVMNRRAQRLGMRSTHFMNPHGLHHRRHYASPADLVRLTRHAMRDKRFRRIVASPRVTVASVGGRRVVVENTNPLLTTFRGANGVKTGFTTPAGYTLVAGAQRRGIQLYAVVLGANSFAHRARAAAKLLRWGFRQLKTQDVALIGASVTVPTQPSAAPRPAVEDSLVEHDRSPDDLDEYERASDSIEGDRVPLAEMAEVTQAPVAGPNLFEKLVATVGSTFSKVRVWLEYQR